MSQIEEKIKHNLLSGKLPTNRNMNILLEEGNINSLINNLKGNSLNLFLNALKKQEEKLSSSKSINKKDIISLFLEVCRNGKVEELIAFLNSVKSDGSPLIDINNDKDKYGNNGLMNAVLNEQNECVRILLAYPNIYVNTTNISKDTPLMIASSKSNTYILKMLLKKKYILINQINNNDDSAILIASKENLINNVKILLENNADFLQKNKKGETCIFYNNECSNIIKIYLIKILTEYNIFEKYFKEYSNKYPLLNKVLLYTKFIQKIIKNKVVNKDSLKKDIKNIIALFKQSYNSNINKNIIKDYIEFIKVLYGYLYPENLNKLNNNIKVLKNNLNSEIISKSYEKIPSTKVVPTPIINMMKITPTTPLRTLINKVFPNTPPGKSSNIVLTRAPIFYPSTHLNSPSKTVLNKIQFTSPTPSISTFISSSKPVLSKIPITSINTSPSTPSKPVLSKIPITSPKKVLSRLAITSPNTPSSSPSKKAQTIPAVVKRPNKTTYRTYREYLLDKKNIKQYDYQEKIIKLKKLANSYLFFTENKLSALNELKKQADILSKSSISNKNRKYLLNAYQYGMKQSRHR
jgi:ankyrin repeat protein